MASEGEAPTLATLARNPALVGWLASTWIFAGLPVALGPLRDALHAGPARAVRCAVTMAEQVRELGIETRSGLHAGEVEARGDDVGGIGVHIASRVMSAAGPGEILVSSTVRDLVIGAEIGFREKGSRILRGVPGRWRLFKVIV